MSVAAETFPYVINQISSASGFSPSNETSEPLSTLSKDLLIAIHSVAKLISSGNHETKSANLSAEATFASCSGIIVNSLASAQFP